MGNNFSIVSQSIKYKLVIAFSLMSVIPLLICLNYIFPSMLEGFVVKSNIPIIAVLVISFSLLGFIVIKQIIDPVAKLSNDAKLIAAGDTDIHIDIKGEDEVGQLGLTLNQLNERVRKSMDELKDYGSRAAQINLEIQKRVLVLSGLLQISNMITEGAKPDEVLLSCVEKATGLGEASLSFILMLENGRFRVKAYSGGLNQEQIKDVDFSDHDMFLINMFQKHMPVLLDSKHPNQLYDKFVSTLGIKNCLCLMIFLNRKPAAILGIGNNIADFTYKNDDWELLDIFAKQITIAFRNDLLVRQIEKLEIKDALTGLYNEHFIRERLEEEIKRAIVYQRPCSFILFSVDNFRKYQDSYGQIASEFALKKIASALSGLISEVDRLGRIGDFEFAAVLPERNKRQAKNLAEQMCKKTEQVFKNEPEAVKRLTIKACVSENPLDGVNAQELIVCARKDLCAVKT